MRNLVAKNVHNFREIKERMKNIFTKFNVFLKKISKSLFLKTKNLDTIQESFSLKNNIFCIMHQLRKRKIMNLGGFIKIFNTLIMNLKFRKFEIINFVNQKKLTTTNKRVIIKYKFCFLGNIMRFYKLNFFHLLLSSFIFTSSLFSLDEMENKNDDSNEVNSILESLLNAPLQETFNNYKYVLVGISDEFIKKYEHVLTDDLIISGGEKLKIKNKIDVNDGLIMMKIAASRGSGKAFRILGLEYSDFAFEDLTPTNYEKALLYFSSGAHLGDPESIFYLSDIVFNGKGGTPKNSELGEKLLRIASKNNSAQAAKRILKLNGENLLSTPLLKNEIKKLITLERNLSLGFGENFENQPQENSENAKTKNNELISAVNMLSSPSPEARKNAVKKLEELAEKKIGAAYYYLGLEYADSFFADDVTPRNLKKAHEYFKEGHKLGAKICDFYYADTLFYAKGCLENKEEAKKIFISSALLGYALSARKVLNLVEKNEIIVGKDIGNDEYAKIHRVQLNEIFFKN